MKYIELVGRIWHFRRRAPRPLQTDTTLTLDSLSVRVGSNGYVRFSLDTASRTEALRRARKFAHLIDEAAAAAGANSRAAHAVSKRADEPSAPSPSAIGPLTQAEIEHAAEVMYCGLLSHDEQLNERAVKECFDGSIAPIQSNIAAVQVIPDVSPHRYEWKPEDIPEASPKGDRDLIRLIAPLACYHLLNTAKKLPDSIDSRLLPFARAFRKFVASMKDRNDALDVPTPPMPDSNRWITVSTLYAKFKVQRTTEKHWKAPETQDQREYGPIVRDFICIVGDKPIGKLTRSDATRYYEHTMSRSDIALGTKKRNLQRITAFLRFGKDKHDVPDILGPLKLSTSYEKAHESYGRFTQEELEALFHSTAYRDCTFSKPSRYWLPILGLYTGARIDELASLRTEEVADLNGVWCYYLSSKRANEGGKNQFAPRWVAIHPAVIAAGFLAYHKIVAEEGHERMFPDVGYAERDGYGKRGTADFVDYRRSVGVGSGKGQRSTKTFHSLRSTLITELSKRNVDADMRRKLVGHSVLEAKKQRPDAHTQIYDQSEFDPHKALAAISQANFSLKHPIYVDTAAMKIARMKGGRGR